MDHYSQCGGDPNIVLHGMAAIAGMRMSGAGRGSPGSDARGERRMAKIPMTFACGLYDRMFLLFC
jgi:hypothetical protein